MSLGNLLLQPQRLQRETGGDPRLEVVQDVLRLATLLGEDAAAQGLLTSIGPALLERVGNRIQAQAAAGVAGVGTELKRHFQPLFLYFEGLVGDVAAVEQDAAALFDVLRRLLEGASALLASIDQSRLQAELEFAIGLLERQLGMSPDVVNNQVGVLLDDVVALWLALPTAIDPATRRRRRLAIRAVTRVRQHLLRSFTLPRIDSARAAASLYRLLRSSAFTDIVAEIRCVLDKLDTAIDAVEDIRAALPAVGGSVGAALVEPEGAAQYCWYASWLLTDVDLPLLAISDVKDKRELVNQFRTHQGGTLKANTVSRFLYAELTLEQQHQVLAYDGSSEPDEALVRMLVAHINHFMQIGPIFTSERFMTVSTSPDPQLPVTAPMAFSLQQVEIIDPARDMPEDLVELMHDYEDSQQLFLFNRRFLEWVYGADVLKTACNAFWRYVERKTVGIKRDVVINGDKRYLMCDDIPLHHFAAGAVPKWQDAPLFVDKGSSNRPAAGATYYRFTRVPALACDIIAQVAFGLEQTGRPTWHLATLQPGHEIGTGIVAGLDILHNISYILFGKPISGYESLGGWGKWLANDLYGPRGLALFGGSFQGLHTSATAGNGFWFWVTVVLGDYIRIFGHNGMLSTIRDVILTFFTLLNSSASNSGDSSLPNNPAANHLKQAGIISPVNTLFAFLLMLVYKRENHSIEIWSAGDIGERREHAFGLWFGGTAGFGILSGLAGSIVSQFIAWQEDWKLLGITILESMGFLFLAFWFFEYLLKDGDTADGTFALTGSYKGYPAKAGSPYRLPFEAGEALYMGQGNNGLFSHNEITNIGSNWQIYAFDLGFDHRQIVRAMRGGTVHSFDDSFADNNEDDPNFIVIQHNTLVADHDDPLGSGTPVMTFARYLHGAQNGVTNVLGASPVGMTINQGDPIMEADDTGTSFHSHLHIYVVMGNASGDPGDQSIPIVFEDVDNAAGLMEFLNWYRAGG